MLKIALGAGFLLLQSSFLLASEGATPAWTNYEVIVWTGDTAYKQPSKLPLFFERLREMGVNRGMVHGSAEPDALATNHFPFYVENVVNRGLCLKFSSKVADWEKAVGSWAREGRPESALVRDYCLNDPQWLGWAKRQMTDAVQRNKAHAPLAYNIRDELSVTISANPFDYDFSPCSLAAFREWLRKNYHDLTALNSEWETEFKEWTEVRPFTTDQIKNRMATGKANPGGKPDWAEVQRLRFDPFAARAERTRWNFAPWADFRSFMDASLAQALSQIRDAGRAADTCVLIGIEGTQMPAAFGGYDLARLSGSLDWVEPYDIGNAREIFGSFMPGKPIMTTVFERDTDHARRRLWHLLLEGDRGCLIWWSEDCIDWKSPGYELTPKARALAPVLKELRGPVAALFLNAQREYDPIGLYYSQPSIQADWLLESTVDGSTWLRRFSSFEADHNRQARARNGWLKLLQDHGYSPRFVTATDLPSLTTLVLPTALAVSQAEMQAARDFRKRGGTILADGSPALFDEHARLRKESDWDALFPPALSEKVIYKAKAESKAFGLNIADYPRERLASSDNRDWTELLRDLPPPSVRMEAETRARVRRFRLNGAQLLAFERNIDYHMSEDLKQRGGNEPLEKPIEMSAKLASSRHLYDLWSGKYLGYRDTLAFTLDPWKPSLFAALKEKAERPVLEELSK